MPEFHPGVDPDVGLLMAHPVPAEATPSPRRRRARVQTGIGQSNDDAPLPSGLDDLDLFEDSNSPEPSPTPAPAETNPNPPALELPPEPGQPNILEKVQFMVVSALGAHNKEVTYRDAIGRETSRTVKSKDVYTIEQADFANRRMTESKDKWDPSSIEGLKGYQRWGKKIEVGLARIWRGTLAEDAHRKKEFALGMELSKISGIDTAVSEEFYSVIEQKARGRIKDERKTRTQKILGGVSDAWAEFTATNSKLHKYEIEEARELRRRYDANPANSDPVENPLYALVNRDVATRESLAARMNENSIDILKQSNPGDKKTTVAIKLEGPAGKKVDAYLKKEILGKIIDDFTTRLDAGDDVTGIEPKLRRESDLKLQNYFMTNEFQDWVKTLPVEQQALFESSFTYATDLLLQAEEGLLPAVKQSLEHFKSGDKLKFDIELSLGTAQLEANTEVTKDGWFSAERKSLNKNLMEKMRGERNTSPESHLYDTDVIHDGMVKDRMMGYVTSIVKSEALWAWLSAITVKGVSIAARKYSELAPSVTAGVVAGTVSGLKEWARMDQIRATRGFGVANGLEFPSTADAVKSAELASADYNRIQMSDRTQQLVESITRFKDGTADVNTAFMAMVYDADTTARLKLNGQRNINLMTASVDGPQGRGIYMRELRQLDKARAMNSVMLETFLSDDAKRNELADLIGIPADKPRDARAMMDRLVISQYNNLLSGVKIDGALSAKLSTLDSKLVLDQSESIRARDKIYNGMHLKSTVKYAATSGALAFAMSWGLGKVFHHEADIASSGHENTSLVMADHTMPHITDNVPTATITDDQGNMVVQTFSHVPAGTHLELVHDQLNGVQDVNPTYNLVVDNNPDKVLIHSIDFGSHGEIVNMTDIQDDLTANHINISPENLHTVGWEVQDVSNPLEGHGEFITQTKDLTMDDLPGYNEQGWSGWFHHTMSADGSAPRDPELNAVLKTFRGFEIWEKNDGANVVNEYPGRVVHYKDLADSIFGGHKDVVAAPQSGTAVFKGIPHLWSTPEGHEAIAKVFDEAEATYKATETFTDEAHRIIYEAGIGGESGVPDASEMKVLLNYDWTMSGAVHEGVSAETVTTMINPVENWFNLQQDVTEIVAIPPENLYTETVADGWTHLAALGYIHPLEAPIGRVKPDTYLQGHYYHALPNQEHIFARVSNSIKENPKAKLNDYEEISKYLENLEPTYRSQVEELSRQLVPMNESTKLAVCIPVADHQEGKTIYKTLESFSRQTANKNEFEIVLLLNHPETNRDGTPTIMDETGREVNRFMSDHPGMQIRIMAQELSLEDAKIGRIRKQLTDATVLRHHNRGATAEPLILLSNDADNTGLSPDYIANYIREFKENPDVDAFVGQVDWDPDAFSKYPLVYLGTRLFQFIERGYKNAVGSVGTQGPNTAYRSNIYAAIGGYDAEYDVAEDILLGQTIKAVRKSDKAVKAAKLVPSRIYTNARRSIDAVKRGLAPVEQWNSGFSAFNDEIRKFELGQEEDINYDDPAEVAKLEEGLTYIVNRTIGLYDKAGWLGENSQDYAKNALRLMNIKHHTENGKIVLDNMDEIVSTLKIRSEMALLMKKLKSGTLTSQEKQRLSELGDQLKV